VTGYLVRPTVGCSIALVQISEAGFYDRTAEAVDSLQIVTIAIGQVELLHRRLSIAAQKGTPRPVVVSLKM
jgi:hypothetical protein